MPWSSVWSLPDPFGRATVRVTVSESDVKHMFNRHLCIPSEPWTDFFPPVLLDELDRCWSYPAEEREPILAQVAGLLLSDIGRGMGRPLVCAYTQLDADRNELHSTWEVVAPAGFLAVVRTEDGRTRLITAYFPQPTQSEKPGRRWVAAAKYVVHQYAVLEKGRGYVLPPEGSEFPSYEQGQFVGNRADVQFVTPATWRFRDGSWQGGPAPWPGLS